MSAAKRAVHESWDSIEGAPAPHGATWVDVQHAWNFSLYSRDARAVRLLIYAADDHVRPLAEVLLDPLVNKTGRIWHCMVGVDRVPGAAHYAFRVDGPNLPPVATCARITEGRWGPRRRATCGDVTAPRSPR